MARLLKLHQFADKHHFCVDLSQKGRNGVTRTSQQPQLSTLRQDVAVAATKHAARTQRAKTAYRKDAACQNGIPQGRSVPGAAKSFQFTI